MNYRTIMMHLGTKRGIAVRFKKEYELSRQSAQ